MRSESGVITATYVVISGGKREVDVEQRTLQNRWKFLLSIEYNLSAFGAISRRDCGRRIEGAKLFGRMRWGGGVSDPDGGVFQVLKPWNANA